MDVTHVRQQKNNDCSLAAMAMALGWRYERVKRHAIVYHNGMVYDPEHTKPRPFDSYPRRHWYLIAIIGRVEDLDRWPRASARVAKVAQRSLFK